jgi:hypothetical protein
MGKYKRIIQRLLELQEMFYLGHRNLVDPWVKEREGTVSLLQIVGLDGESLLLKYEDGRLKYAQGDESPKHVFVCSGDTFLDLIAEPTGENLRRKVTKGHFYIRDAPTGEINLVEMTRWVRAFEALGRVAKHALLGEK